MRFLIDDIHGETIESNLYDVTENIYIYIDGIMCKLNTARSREKAALQVVLDAVDYTIGNCRSNEMVGAVLSKQVIELARKALQG